MRPPAVWDAGTVWARALERNKKENPKEKINTLFMIMMPPLVF